MPNINQYAHYLSGPFDESINNKSKIFSLGGPILTIHVVKNEPTDIGTVTLCATNVEYVDGATDEYMGWNVIATCSTDSGPISMPSYYAYGQFIYVGKGRIGCSYSDGRDSSGGSGPSGSFGAVGQQISASNSASEVRQILQLGSASTMSPSLIGAQLMAANSDVSARGILGLGTASTVNYGEMGKSLLLSQNQNDARYLLGVNFGNTSDTFARGDHIHSNYIDKNIGGQYSAHVGTSLIPSLATDFVNKQYVDTLVSGFKYKSPAKAATTSAIDLFGIQTIDGINVIEDDRVLVKNQTLSKYNGVYIVKSQQWIRAPDFDDWSEIPASLTIIESGQTLADTAWICISDESGTLGVTDISFVQNFSAAQQLLQGPGINISGNTIELEQSGVTPGTYSKVVIDNYGRTTHGSNLTSDDVKYLLGYIPLQNGGDPSMNNSLVKIGQSIENNGLKAINNGVDLGYFIMSGNPSQGRTHLGLGDSAIKNVGTGSNDVAAGNHDHADFMLKTGGLFQNNAGCSQPPTITTDYTNKQYVDNLFTSGGSGTSSSTFAEKFGYGPSTFIKITGVDLTTPTDTSTTRRYVATITMNCLSGVIETKSISQYTTSTVSKAVAINNNMVTTNDIVIAKIQWIDTTHLSPNYFVDSTVSTYIDPYTSALVFKLPPSIATVSGTISIRFVVIKST